MAMTDAIVHGQRPLVYGLVRGVRFHAVSAVTGCVGMVNVSGAWSSGGLSIRANRAKRKAHKRKWALCGKVHKFLVMASAE